jgi:pyruvate carboxylase
MIRTTGFVFKQVMPYYDRYTAPFFKGVDHDVVSHAMPGGATSSSQEGAMKQGYIHLLPHMLRFLAGTRKIVRYHDVTPGSQITWNTAFLAVTTAWQRGGEEEVNDLLWILESVADTPEAELTDALKNDRLILYRDSNDAFRDLITGKFGRMPLGFPPDWVYESAFGDGYRAAIEGRTADSPLAGLAEVDIEAERGRLSEQIKRAPTHEEVVMYLNHPGDALKTILFRQEYGNPNWLPLDVWFEGLEPDRDMLFKDTEDKPHSMRILGIGRPDFQGMSAVRYSLNGELFTHTVKVAEATGAGEQALEMADRGNPCHVASPSNGDLWILYVKPGDIVKEGEELFNITIMKQEKAVTAPMAGIVERVLKTADYKYDKKMVPVKEGELLVVLGPVPLRCSGCQTPIKDSGFKFCPACGKDVSE